MGGWVSLIRRADVSLGSEGVLARGRTTIMAVEQGATKAMNGNGFPYSFSGQAREVLTWIKQYDSRWFGSLDEVEEEVKDDDELVVEIWDDW